MDKAYKIFMTIRAIFLFVLTVCNVIYFAAFKYQIELNGLMHFILFSIIYTPLTIMYWIDFYRDITLKRLSDKSEESYQKGYEKGYKEGYNKGYDDDLK